MKTKDPQESNLIKHMACDECGSSDGNGLYDDGHTYCYVCNTYKKGDGELVADRKPKSQSDLKVEGEIKELLARRIREDTCKLWGYRQGSAFNKKSGKSEGAQLAYYYDPITLEPVACKARFANKEFTFLGNPKQAPLYGQWLWKPGGKIITVTEGEIDALSVSQANSNKWPVVSVQTGARGADKSCKAAYDYLNSFEKIVFMFDMDEPGREAAVKCAKLFPPGKAYIASLHGGKDANDLLVAGRSGDIVNAIFNAQPYRPDGIVSAVDLWEEIAKEDETETTPYLWEGLNDKLRGIRKRELVTITAGSGIGKSAICREIAYDLIVSHGFKVGYIALEESVKRSLLGFVGIGVNKPVHITREGVDDAELRAAYESIAPNLFLYDSFGSLDPDDLIDRIRYLAVAMQCDVIVLDHISIAISGLEDIDERRALDVMMTRLRSLVEETGVALIVVSHLKRPEGKGHEEGAKTSLAQLRGSAAIAQLSDIVIGLERNQQGEDPNRTNVRVLKNRFTGETGLACSLIYDRETGRLSESSFEEEDF